MEDFLKFLLIAGVVLLGIFREVNKNKKSKKTQKKHPIPPIPSPVEITSDSRSMPHPKERGKPFNERKKAEISVAASLANSSAQDHRNEALNALLGEPESGNQGEFAIHSAEDARKAIIWGEILERKY